MSELEFIDLHVHTEYSRGKSLANIDEIVERATEFGMPALAITDSESLSGIPEFYLACKNAGIKPILGAGFNFEPNYGFSDNNARYHIVLLAKNKRGYKNLLKLMEEAYLDNKDGIPKIDMQILSNFYDDLICLSGGFGGVLDKLLREDEKVKATRTMEFFVENFGEENFYIELQDHEFENNIHQMIEFKNFSMELHLPMVVTGGSFYVMRTDAVWCDELRRTRNQEELQGNSYYFKSQEEIITEFEKVPEAIKNTKVIADQCNVDLSIEKLKKLNFDPEDNELTNIRKQLEVLF